MSGLVWEVSVATPGRHFVLNMQILHQLKHSNQAFGLLLVLVIFLLAMPLYFQSRAEAQDKRVVSIYVDGETKRLATDAQTVGEALERADVTLGDNDLAEPSPEVPITQDAFNINVYRARPVTVIDGQDRYRVMTAFQSPPLIAQAAGLEVFPEDNFDFERVTDFVTDQTIGLKLIIDRATPVVLNIYGTRLDMRTHALTVGEFFEEQEISFDKDDAIKPKVDTKIRENLVVKVSRVGTQIVAEEKAIPFAQETIRDTSKNVGFRDVKTAGKNGAKLVTYEVTYHDGKEVSRKALNEVVKSQPVTEVVVIGVNGSPSPDMWASLRQCEAGGNYSTNTGNGFYGAYQFTLSTWQGHGGTGLPHEATPDVQDEIALRLWQARGFQPWPACRVKLGLP